jgi:hypothetical protein
MRRGEDQYRLVAWASGARPRTLLTSTKVHASDSLAARELLYREPAVVRTIKTGSARSFIDVHDFVSRFRIGCVYRESLLHRDGHGPLIPRRDCRLTRICQEQPGQWHQRFDDRYAMKSCAGAPECKLRFGTSENPG